MIESGHLDLADFNTSLPNVRGLANELDAEDTRESGRSIDRYGNNDYGFGTYVKRTCDSAERANEG